MAGERKIELNDAIALLMNSPRVHVVRVRGDGKQTEELRNRDACIEELKRDGAQIAGLKARSAHHGLCSVNKDGVTTFYETGHT